MSDRKKYTERYTLAGILILASALRLYGFGDWSLTNDELSALGRLNFPSFGEMIEKGVRPDGHPAFTQTLLYFWTNLFGNDPWAVRLPFVLFGIASVYYFYLIIKKWFSVTAAQFSALALACLSYPILYSQLARPYSPGLFFSLMMVWHWSNILFSEKPRTRDLIGYALTLALCMYTHYFGFLFAVLVGASGLFFLNKNSYKHYLGAAVVAILLFLPHMGISLTQVSYGGVGQWLGKPEPGFLSNYIIYAFDDSSILLYATIAVFIVSLSMNLRMQSGRKFRLLSLAWFLVPFLVGYYYSVNYNPVLQYSVLLFSFPFLLAFLFSYFSDPANGLTYIVMSAYTALLLWGTIGEQKFYSQKPFGVFKELAEKENEWRSKYGNDNVRILFNVISPSYIDFYYGQADLFSEGSRNFIRGSEAGVVGQVSDLIDSKEPGGDLYKGDEYNSEYFIYGWSNIANPPEIYEIIKASYPVIVEDHNYFNSRVTLFKREQGSQRKALLDITNSFEEDQLSSWYGDPKQMDTTASYTGKRSFRLGPEAEYSGGFDGKLSDLTKDTLSYINVSARIQFSEQDNLNLVVEFHKRENDSLYSWHSAVGKNFITRQIGKDRWSYLLLTQKIPPEYRSGDKIKVYVWNPDKQKGWVDDIRISSFADMDYEAKYDFK